MPTKTKRTGVELYESKSGASKGTWRGRVTAMNGRVLVTTSEGYVDREDARKALKAAATIIKGWEG